LLLRTLWSSLGSNDVLLSSVYWKSPLEPITPAAVSSEGARGELGTTLDCTDTP
jgi:hypothetical protein